MGLGNCGELDSLHGTRQEFFLRRYLSQTQVKSAQIDAGVGTKASHDVAFGPVCDATYQQPGREKP